MFLGHFSGEYALAPGAEELPEAPGLPPNPFFRLPAGERPPEHTAGSLRQAGELLLESGPL